MVFILVGIIMFLIIPRSGKLEFLELGLILIFSFATEIVSFVGVHIIHANMNLASNTFDILYLPLAVLLYRKRIHWKNTNVVATVIVVLYVLFALVNLFIIQGPFNYNGYANSLASVCFILMSLTYFYVLIQQLPAESITKLPMFWINTAILIYHSGTFFLYLTADYLITVLNNDLITFWMFHHFFGLIYLTILWYALWLIRRYSIQKTLSPPLFN
jgi:hypothetical protein